MAIIFLSWLFLGSLCFASEDEQSLIKSGDECEARSDKSGMLEKALEYYQEAAQVNPQSEMVWEKISRVYWHIGDQLPIKRKKEKLAYYDQGMKAGEKAMAINPESVGGTYWYAANFAATGEVKGILQSLWMLPKLFEYMEKVEKLDKTYDYGAVNRFWTVVLIKVPNPILRIAGHSHKEAVELMQEAIGYGPGHLSNHLMLAGVYYKLKEIEKAKEKLKWLTGADPEALPEERGDNRQIVKRSAYILKAIENGKKVKDNDFYR